MRQMSTQTETKSSKSGMQIAQRVVGVFFSIVELLLVFRFFLKLFGANAGNGFVSGIYAITQIFVGLFEGIFSRAAADNSAGTTSVFEPATLIALLVVAIIAWVVLKLMTPRTGTRVESSEYTERDDEEK